MKKSSGNDYELIQEVAQKDHEAFQKLVHRYKRMVINVCFRLTGDRENAEDVAQEVFFRVYQKAKAFRGRSRLSTWIYRIAVNLSLNYNRKQNNFFQKKYPSAHFNSPDTILENKEDRQIIKKALDSLPEKQRTAFILHHWEGLSYQEIAEILKSSLSAIESRIHRAKRSLKDALLFMMKKK
ncbi:MAG: sigma-70 family RNA polymerase sigma factor [Candidatus Aminicenantes bacterium]|nr:sigma-70 family RNA polymerase sigma factor [Candidatus Aminicenantes bacterium]